MFLQLPASDNTTPNHCRSDRHTRASLWKEMMLSRWRKRKGEEWERKKMATFVQRWNSNAGRMINEKRKTHTLWKNEKPTERKRRHVYDILLYVQVCIAKNTKLCHTYNRRHRMWIAFYIVTEDQEHIVASLPKQL